MDSRLKSDRDELEKLAQALLKGPEGMEALAMLGGLESLARESILAIPAQAPTPSPVPAPAAPLAAPLAAQVPQTPRPSNRFGIDPQALIRAARAQLEAQNALRAGITPPLAPKAAAPKPAAPSRAVPPVTTSRTEYQSALRDEKLIEALLEYQRTAVQEQRTPTRKNASFAPLEIPEVEAKPKPRQGFRKSTGVGYPILRGKS